MMAEMKPSAWLTDEELAGEIARYKEQRALQKDDFETALSLRKPEPKKTLTDIIERYGPITKIACVARADVRNGESLYDSEDVLCINLGFRHGLYVSGTDYALDFHLLDETGALTLLDLDYDKASNSET